MKDLQEKLYAENKQALLIVLQAMDAAGKDSLIKNNDWFKSSRHSCCFL